MENPIVPQTDSQVPSPIDARAQKKRVIKLNALILVIAIAVLISGGFGVGIFSQIPILNVFFSILISLSPLIILVTVVVLVTNLIKPAESFQKGTKEDVMSPAYDKRQLAILRNGLIIFAIFILIQFLVPAFVIFFGIFWIIYMPVMFFTSLGFLIKKKPKLAGIYFLTFCAILIIGYGVCSRINYLGGV